MDIYENLLNHYQKMAKALENTDQASKVFPASDSARRQDLLKHFLASHLPPRLHVTGESHIFDSEGNVSASIDLAVSSDLALHYQHPPKNFHCLEGCHASIVLEERLDGHSCIDALQRIASIPVMPEVPPGLGILFAGKVQNNMMVRAVFAFDGADPEEVLDEIDRFYSENQVADSARPNLVIVNNRYGIMRTGEQGALTADGCQLQPNSFLLFGCVPTEPKIGGYSLLYLLSEIQRAAAAATNCHIDYGAYLDQLPL